MAWAKDLEGGFNGMSLMANLGPGRVPSAHVREMNELVRKHMETKGMELE